MKKPQQIIKTSLQVQLIAFISTTELIISESFFNISFFLTESKNSLKCMFIFIVYVYTIFSFSFFRGQEWVQRMSGMFFCCEKICYIAWYLKKR